MFGLASILGPPIGGLPVGSLSGRWIFWLNVLLGEVVVAIVLAVLRIGDRPGAGIITSASRCTVARWGGVPCPGGELGRFDVRLEVAAHPRTDRHWVLFSIGLVVNEHRAAESMLPLSLFQIPAVAACMAVGFLTALRLFGAITYLPLLLRIGFDTNAAGGGLLFLRSWQPWWPRRRLRDARSAKPSDT